MPPTVVALMFGAGFGAWVYTKIYRNTGGNTQNALVVAAVATVFGFMAMLLLLRFIDQALL